MVEWGHSMFDRRLERFGEAAVPIMINMLDDHRNVGGQYDAALFTGDDRAQSQRGLFRLSFSSCTTKLASRNHLLRIGSILLRL